jgi:hypothetical protein
MSEPISPPYPQQRTAEQHEAVRRRALPIAFSAAILGIAGLILQVTSPVGVLQPPNLLAVNLSFCAILMGAGIVLYTRGTPGTAWAVAVSIFAVITGMIGPMVFARQTVEHHRLVEDRELNNVTAIALAARKYADGHEGVYPADLLVMLDEKLLSPADLQSPFVFKKGLHDVLSNLDSLRKTMSRADLLKAVETDSDYLYLGGDLKIPPGPPTGATAPATAALPGDIIVASSNTTVMRINLALSFADGSSRFITIDDIPQVMESCNAGRARLGLGTLRPPPIIEHAIDEATTRAR